MKISSLFVYSVILVFAASSCSTQPVVPLEPEHSMSEEIVEQPATPNREAVVTESELRHSKQGKTLELVRVLEGGACKNELQGLQGMFMLYANPEDVERIKQQQGNEVFAEFEQAIKQFSIRTLQDVVDRMEFTDDPFALDEEDRKQKLVEQFNEQFVLAIAYPITEFENETTLTIDLIPLLDSLYWFLDGCQLPHAHENHTD